MINVVSSTRTTLVVVVKKTKGFINAGYVDPDKLEFTANYKVKIYDRLADKSDQLDALSSELHTKLFRAHPFEEENVKEALDKWFSSAELRNLLQLDS